MAKTKKQKSDAWAFMSPDEYRQSAIKIAGTVQAFSQAMRIPPRTGYRYACGSTEVPAALADIVRLLATGKITIKQIEATRK